MKMTKLLKTTVMTLTLCLSLSFGAVLTANAEDLSEAEKQNLAFKDCPVTQVTPGGVNIYGYEDLGITNPLTGEIGSRDWPAIYVNAIDAAGITNEMSDYDKAVAIANYLCGALEYDHAHSGIWEEDKRESETVTGNATHGNVALAKGLGVCGHYADAFEDLCCMVNVECYGVGGTTTNGAGNTDPHEWNEIHIGGTVYYTDVTWLDSSKDSKYLMSTTEWSDHHRGGTSQYHYTQEWYDNALDSIIIMEHDPFWDTQNMDELEWYDF